MTSDYDLFTRDYEAWRRKRDSEKPSKVYAAAPPPPLTPMRPAKTFQQLKEERIVWHMAEREAKEAIAALDANDADIADAYIDIADLDALPTPEMLIEGVLPIGCALLVGRDRSFKSLLALDWALSVATGRPWLERDTRKGKALYVAGEGVYGLKGRKAAWLKHHEVLEVSNMTIRKAAVNLFKGGPAWLDLLDRAEQYDLIVLDTLRRMSGGAAENSSDMGLVTDRITELQQRSGGCVLTVAHTTKADTDARGHSSIEDDSDAVWRVKRADEFGMAVTITLSKFKDGPDGTSIDLHATEVQVLDGLTSGLVLLPALGLNKVAGRDAPTRERVLELVAENAATGLSVARLVGSYGVAESSAYKALNALATAGQITKRGQLWYPA
jgi:hypothetical protein